MLDLILTLHDHRYVDHSHVTWSFVAVGIGVLLLVLGLLRKVLVLAGLAVVVIVVGVVLGVISLHGTHCTPTTHHRVCLTEQH